MKTFFSIIIPVYNREKLIQRAIQSVLDQTYENWELIIIDDGSTDSTAQIIKGNNDNRIRYFFQKNAERSVARNNGILKANGEWICFLDSDDYFLSNHLLSFYNFIK
jgi:glycosyltransferase involved in cell wall biosynthesis